MDEPAEGVGTVKTRFLTFGESGDGLVLDSGLILEPVTIAYETYGTLNANKDNAILICHALSGDAHAAGLHKGVKKRGWWDGMIGPGRAFDTNEYCVICSNCIGGCMGSTGPSSANPKTGKPYALSFPIITIGDMVRAQKRLLDHLSIRRLFSISGGSMGGMQVLRWAVDYPDAVATVIPVATTARHSPQQIAFNEVGRRAIVADPQWRGGDYYGHTPPNAGLAVARMVGHITYLSDKSMEQKFGRRLRGKEKTGSVFSVDFEVESYLEHQGLIFTQRFDANSYLYITKALDYFDLAAEYGSLSAAFARVEARCLAIAFSSDWLYPPYQVKEIVSALRSAGRDATYCEIESSYGHDAFLIELEQQTAFIRGFLASTRHGLGGAHVI